jgi:hypothetical protein
MRKPERVPEVLAQAKSSGSGGVGENFCVSNGNAIKLQWLDDLLKRAKKNNGFRKQGG